MARMPDGYVITIEANRREVIIHDAKELITCKNCDHCYFASNRVPEEQSFACDLYGIDVTENFYCADGKLKVEDKNNGYIH